MSIKLRLALLLGLLLTVFVSCLFALRALEQRQVTEAMAAARRDDARLIENWLELRAASLGRFVEDAIESGELADAGGVPDSNQAEEARRRLDSLLTRYGVDFAWLVAPDGTVLHAARREGLPAIAPPMPENRPGEQSAPKPEKRAFFSPGPRSGEVLEVRATRPEGTAAPWFFAARLWDAAYLARLGDLTDSRVELVPLSADDEAGAAPGEASEKATGIAPVVMRRPLTGWSGEPVRTLLLRKAAPDISFRVEADRLKTHVFLLFGLCLIASLAVSLHQWVLRPLGWITDSLSRQDTTSIRPLLQARTELTRVARLIETSFEHREQLRREIAERRNAEAALKRTMEERARLGRDLHDGLIQAIYAAGMGIAAARKRVGEDPAAAERQLVQVAGVLNDTIREVREFITGLDSEPPGDRAFTQTVERLFSTMNTGGGARAELDLDEALAARLPTSLRTELLLLLREAMSNALRHGEARQVRIRLVPAPGGPDLALLEIGDDGIGFDPATVRRGRGLDNLFTRAAGHGARASLESAPGKGTRLAFVIPLPPLEEDDETLRQRETPPVRRTGSARAFSLVEVMVASCVLMLGISGALVTLQRSLDSIAQARQLDAASQLLQTELERVRLLNWAQLQSLQDSGRTTFEGPAGGDFARFTWERQIRDLREGMKEITVIAFWGGPEGRAHSARLITRYSRSGLNDYFYTSR